MKINISNFDFIVTRVIFEASSDNHVSLFFWLVEIHISIVIIILLYNYINISSRIYSNNNFITIMLNQFHCLSSQFHRFS